jgi:signal transduction histidine kinase
VSVRQLPIPGLRSELNERLFQKIVVGGVGVGFLILALTAAAAVWGVLQNQSWSNWVSHTYEVTSSISEYRIYTERAEAARRGLILTGQARYVNIYTDAIRKLPPQIERLSTLTADNPRQQANVAKLQVLHARQLALFQTTLAQMNHGGPQDDAIHRFIADSVPAVTLGVRNLTEAMQAEESRLLTQREHDRQASARFVYVAFSLAAVLMVLVGWGSIWVILRYTQDLTASRARLAQLNEGLEEAVAVRTADLVRANDEIQRFAYIVSHDLRSPLVNVMGFTSELEAAAVPLNALVQRAQAEAPHMVTAEARAAVAEDLPEAIGFIRSSTQKMDRLINAILRLSREGRRVLSPEVLDMNAVLEGVVDSVRHRAAETGVELVLEKPLPGLVNDRLAIEQVFSNLVENAIKYTKPGRGGRVTLRGRSEMGRLVYEVQDEGRGIDPKDHERIFELFRRSGVQDQPGEGIGLAHVRALVYRLGGAITCDSALDRGATFRVSLPPIVKTDPSGAS